jgi:hypothetical protein
MEGLSTTQHDFKLSDTAKERIILGIRLICMFLFLYTAHAKLVDHDRFLKGLTRVRMISSIANYISWTIPVAEIITFVFLLVPRTAKWGLYAFTGLMISFSLYILSAMLWEEKLPCHCGGVIEKLTWTQHLWFNLGFIGLAILALRLFRSNNSNKRQNEKS